MTWMGLRVLLKHKDNVDEPRRTFAMTIAGQIHQKELNEGKVSVDMLLETAAKVEKFLSTGVTPKATSLGVVPLQQQRSLREQLGNPI